MNFKTDLTTATEAFQVESKKAPLYLITAEYRNIKSRHFVVVTLHGKKGTELDLVNAMGRMKAPVLPEGYQYASNKAVNVTKRGCPALVTEDFDPEYNEAEYTVDLPLEVVAAETAPAEKPAAKAAPAKAEKPAAKAAPAKAEKPAAKKAAKAEKAAPAEDSDLIKAIAALNSKPVSETWTRPDGRVWNYTWEKVEGVFQVLCAVDASKSKGQRTKNVQRTTKYDSKEAMVEAARRIEAKMK